MARKAGPGDGAEDAPEGRADLSPEESGFVPDARLAEPVGEDAGVRSLDAEAGTTGSLPGDDVGMQTPDKVVSGPGDDAEGLRASSGSISASPEDWRLAMPIGEGGGPAFRPGTDLLDVRAGDAEPSEHVGRPDSASEGDASTSSRADPFLLTTPIRPAEDSGRAWEPSSARDGSGLSGSSVPPVASLPPRRRGGFGGLLLGGMIAAALGFGAAWLAQDRLGLLAARLPADIEARLAALETRPVPDGSDLQPLTDRLAEVETRLSAIEDAPAAVAEPAAAVDLEPLRQEIEQGLAEAQEQAAGLEERLAALEARPAAPTGGAAPLGSLAQDPGPAVRPAPAVDPETLRADLLAAVEPRLAGVETGLADTQAGLDATEAGLAEVRTALTDAQTALDALTARLDGAEAQSAAAVEEARTAVASLAEAQTRAATAESEARARAALGQVETSLAAGEPFEAPLSELGGTGLAVPDTLAQLAAEGAPTLATLRESFPDAARAGLSAAREQGLLEDGSGVLGFLRGQLSVRSVAPREGEDPDAVLSRAEAQLAAGQLGAALTEIGSLPEPVRAAMADWVAQAETRAQADAALAGLRDAVPALDAPPAD